MCEIFNFLSIPKLFLTISGFSFLHQGEGFDVMKSGDARVALIGFPSVGKVCDNFIHMDSKHQNDRILCQNDVPKNGAPFVW